MKKAFTILIACLAIIGLSAQNVPTTMPFQFSTNTTDGAVWYFITIDKYGGGYEAERPWFVENLNAPLHIQWSDPNPNTEEQLFCFVGDNTNGFHIYNKACLAGKTINSITLSEDLKLQNLQPYQDWNSYIGFTTTSTVTGDDLMNKFVIVQGNGENHDGLARTDHYKLCILDKDGNKYTWRRSDGNDGQLCSADWGDLYYNQFTPESGETPTDPTDPTDPSDPNAPANSAGFPFKLSGNTTDQAAWYYILWSSNGNSDHGAWRPGDDGILNVAWGDPAHEDQFLYCFIGNATEGVEIYNKAKGNLKFQNFTTDEWAKGGYTASSSVSGTDLFDKWFFEQGQGQGVDGGPARVGYYLIHNANKTKAWWKDNGANMEVGPVSNWAGAFAQKIQWVEGQGLSGGTVDPTDPTDPNAPANSDGLPFKLSANTTNKAAWYYILWSNNGNSDHGAWKPDNENNNILGLNWGDPAYEDLFLYCFIGSATEGVAIYNKAMGNLKLQNISTAEWSKGGYTASSSVSGADLTDKWFFEEGEGQGVDGGPARVGYYLIHNANKTRAWWRSGGSELEVGPVANWAGAYAQKLQWVEGLGDVTANSNPEITSDFKYYVSDRSVVLEDVEGKVALTSILGATQQVIATGGLTTIPVNAPGVYILSVNGKSYKVSVK